MTIPSPLFLDLSVPEEIYEKYGIELNEIKAPAAREQIALIGVLALTLQSNRITLMQRIVHLNIGEIADKDYRDHLTLLKLLDDRIQKLQTSLDPIKRHFATYGYDTDHPIPLEL